VRLENVGSCAGRHPLNRKTGVGLVGNFHQLPPQRQPRCGQACGQLRMNPCQRPGSRLSFRSAPTQGVPLLSAPIRALFAQPPLPARAYPRRGKEALFRPKHGRADVPVVHRYCFWISSFCASTTATVGITVRSVAEVGFTPSARGRPKRSKRLVFLPAEEFAPACRS